MRYYEYLLPNGNEPITATSIKNLRFPKGTRIRAVIADRHGYILDSWRIPLTKDGKPILKGRSIKSYNRRYSYFEALNLVERVMLKSLIRKYCTQICKATAVGIGRRNARIPPASEARGSYFVVFISVLILRQC